MAYLVTCPKCLSDDTWVAAYEVDDTLPEMSDFYAEYTCTDCGNVWRTDYEVQEQAEGEPVLVEVDE